MSQIRLHTSVSLIPTCHGSQEGTRNRIKIVGDRYILRGRGFTGNRRWDLGQIAQ